MHILLTPEMGLLFSLMIGCDLGAIALWHAGKKEHVRSWRKRARRQRWWAYRLWLMNAVVRFVLFYICIIGLLK